MLDTDTHLVVAVETKIDQALSNCWEVASARATRAPALPRRQHGHRRGGQLMWLIERVQIKDTV